MTAFPPSRSAALDRLAAFAPLAGRSYAARRNHDLPGHADVSRLSPYIRHRALTEVEVLRAVLAIHSPAEAEKFISEVFWRTYWKGWLEHRPSVWASYLSDRTAAWNRVQTEAGLRQDWEAACDGRTGIDAFDHWARELVQTGYLHNHARMWFASIWIFTLRLPWALGADFFLRHLLDGDPASNTLSWRWVAGLQTRGKTYLARRSNISRYTDGRFSPAGLATEAPALDGPPAPAPGPLPVSAPVLATGRIGLLVTEEDLSPGWIGIAPAATASVQVTEARTHLKVASQVTDFVSELMNDAAPDATPLTPAGIAAWAERESLDTIVTSYVPVGPTRDALAPHFAAARVQEVLRPYDTAAWPHATKGFFRFKDAIPDLLDRLR